MFIVAKTDRFHQSAKRIGKPHASVEEAISAARRLARRCGEKRQVNRKDDGALIGVADPGGFFDLTWLGSTLA